MRKNEVPGGKPALEDQTSTVRERTLAHMENLLRKATKLGAGIALACGVATQGCMKHTVDPPPPPPPGTCTNPDLLVQQGCILANAHWKKSGLKWTVVLDVGFVWPAPGASFEGLRRDDIQVSGATLLSVSPVRHQLAVVLKPVRGGKQVALDCSMQFDSRPIPIRVTLDLSKPHKNNALVPVQVAK